MFPFVFYTCPCSHNSSTVFHVHLMFDRIVRSVNLKLIVLAHGKRHNPSVRRFSVRNSKIPVTGRHNHRASIMLDKPDFFRERVKLVLLRQSNEHSEFMVRRSNSYGTLNRFNLFRSVHDLR